MSDTGYDATAKPQRIRAPGPWLMLMEARAPLEFAAGLAATPWLSRLPAGDGHPVIVFPGLGASEASTRPMRRLLERLGYAVHDWGQGANHGPRPGVMDGCRALIDQVGARSGRSVSLIGWSLGGIYARELAKQRAAQTRCVITLGTPFTGDLRANNVTRLYERMSGRAAGHDPERAARLRQPPPVPTTSIYSRSDGFVSWRCSLNVDGPQAENVEVRASHLGLGAHPAALYVIADRLRQDPAQWQRFDAHPAHRRLFGGLRARQHTA
jgi:pimeloyl-ACP methyl ester carboxylesterase